MQVIRVAEIPNSAKTRLVSRVLDGDDLDTKSRLISSLTTKFDAKEFLSKRYGEPDVVLDEGFSWRLKLNSMYTELRLVQGAVTIRVDGSVSIEERNLIVSHFLNMFTEESKSVWDRKPLGMKAFNQSRV